MKHNYFIFNICRTKRPKTCIPSEVSLGSAPSHFKIHWSRHMHLSDAAADDYGEDEGHYCRLTYLLMVRRRIKGPKQAPLCSPASCFSRRRRRSIHIITRICSVYSSGRREASFPASAPCRGLICFPWDGGDHNFLRHSGTLSKRNSEKCLNRPVKVRLIFPIVH